jgi:hypothetical protein
MSPDLLNASNKSYALFFSRRKSKMETLPGENGNGIPGKANKRRKGFCVLN